jgi:D-3-phosphoglycerate dehydrogenase
MSFEILVATDLTEESLSLLRAAQDASVTVVAPTLAAIRPHLAQTDALIVRDDTQVDAAMLDLASHLKLIACVSVGLNNIDLEMATKRGILVMNTPGANALAAGEHTMALMLALSRRLTNAHTSLKDGYWLLDRARQAGLQLQGKTLGIIGLGRVGKIVAARSLAFGMNVLAFDPYVSEEDTGDRRVHLVGLKDLLMRSDFVSLHVPVTRETRNLLNAESLALLKRGARLINTAHGAVVDERALADALKSGHLAGAAVDVYSEVPPYNNPLIGMDSVIHTPHIGDNTLEAMKDLSLMVAEQVLDALRDVDYRNVINLPLLPGMDYETVRPYVRLADCMGMILHTLARSAVRRVAVEVRGDDLLGMIKPISVGILKGLLSPVLGEKVSAVNAPVLATERGWQMTQVKGVARGEYSNTITCQITLEDNEPITITGTLLDHREPHIVQINQYRMNFVPEGYMLLMGSYDKPGVIGRVGTLLSAHNVNIASWHTGREGRGGNTLTVMTLDEAIPDDVMSELRAQDFVRHAHQVKI